MTRRAAPSILPTMNFGENPVATFLDADRIWRALELIAGAPNLYESAADRFPDAPAEVASSHDEEAFQFLDENDFIDAPQDLRNAIDKYVHLYKNGDRTREDLTVLYRRLKMLLVQIKKAERDAHAGFSLLKSKTQVWDEQVKIGSLKQEFDELTLKRRRMESDLEKCGTLFKETLERVYQTQVLREAFWYHETPVVLTKYGVFLRGYLGEMNPTHFRGRTLGEIIEIGASLG